MPVNLLKHLSNDELIRQQLGLFYTMIENADDCFYVVNLDDGVRMIYVNAAAEHHYGYPRDTIYSWHVSDWDPNFGIRDTQALVDRIKQEKNLIIQSVHCLRDGTVVPVEITINLFVDETNANLAYGWFKNISRRLEMEREQHEAVENLLDLYDHAPCGYHSVDSDGVIIQINQTELNWLGYSREEVVGKKRMLDFYTEEGRNRSQELFPRFKRTGSVHDLEYEMVRRDGTTFPVLLNAVAIYDQAGRFVKSRAITFDLTTRVELERQLVEQARTDFITGLSNRRYFFELANREMERSQRFGNPLSLLMFDVDHFKRVNDTYGHEIGDMVLKHIADACRDTLRKIDSAARIGGEEFAVLLPETNGDEALEVAERLRKTIERGHLALGIGKIRSTVSIGISSWHGDHDHFDAMLRRADKAMYRAKGDGRNCVRPELPGANGANG